MAGGSANWISAMWVTDKGCPARGKEKIKKTDKEEASLDEVIGSVSLESWGEPQGSQPVSVVKKGKK